MGSREKINLELEAGKIALHNEAGYVISGPCDPIGTACN